MANGIVSVEVNRERHDEGETVNVYDTYAHALAHAATGLSTIYGMNPLDGTSSGAISQVAKTTGLKVDQFGRINFLVDTSEVSVYLMAKGCWGAPLKVLVVAD